MLTAEQKFVIRTVRDHIHNEKTQLTESLDWEEVLKLSCAHQISAIVFSQCKELVPEELYGKFNKLSTLTMYTSIKRKTCDEQLFSKLRSEGISFFVMKGQEFAKFYPVDVYRTMGDTDLVVDDRDATHELLMREGYTNASKIQSREWQYYKEGLEYEIHDRPSYKEHIDTDEIDAFYSSFKDYVINGRLDDSYHFVYGICHLRKHFMNRGVGLRQFIDIAVLVKNNKSLDWQWIEQKLDEIKIMDFSKNVFALIESWFSVSSPIEAEKLSPAFFESSTEYIMRNGVFGYENEDNDRYLASNKVREEKHSGLFQVLNVIKALFPSKETLIETGKFDYLKKLPWLLPIAWLLRIFGGVFNEGQLERNSRRLKNSFVSQDYIDSREKMFESWGLREQ